MMFLIIKIINIVSKNQNLFLCGDLQSKQNITNVILNPDFKSYDWKLNPTLEIGSVPKVDNIC